MILHRLAYTAIAVVVALAATYPHYEPVCTNTIGNCAFRYATTACAAVIHVIFQKGVTLGSRALYTTSALIVVRAAASNDFLTWCILLSSTIMLHKDC
jgi:hypothetical protein